MDDSDDEEDEQYDLSPDEDELDETDESDELDDMEDPRIVEIDSYDELVGKPSIVNGSKEPKKGKNKRSAEESEDESSTLDRLMAKSLKPEAATNGEKKLSKKQQKKLKNNAGQAVEAVQEPTTAKAPSTDSPATAKSDKKVQFAQNLELGPTNSQKTVKPEPKQSPAAESKADDGKPKPSLGVKMVQGVKVDDKKLGSGRVAKSGDRVSLRYIGKLENGKVFDGQSSR
jgi:FK506-binding nuclear protein